MAPPDTTTHDDDIGAATEHTTQSSGERAHTWRMISVVALAAVLGWSMVIISAVVLESLGRDRLSQFVAERVQSILSLDPGHPVDVDIGGSLLAFQLISQRLHHVEVTAHDVSLGELTGDMHLTVTGMPLDTSQPFDRVEAHVRVEEDLVAQITSTVTNAVISSVELDEPLIKMGTTVKFPAVVVFGVTLIPEFGLDVGVGMEPFVADGKIAFTPVSVEVDGNELSAEAFADAYRDAAQTVMQVGAICVADQLPAAIVVESVAVSGDELVIGLGASNAVFSNESLSTRGECG